MPTPADLLARALTTDGSRPFLTYYDDANGERVELSIATTANWVAKTANYLLDEHDIQPGDVISVRLPLHWQTAVVLLASWAVGAQVSFDDGGIITFTTPDVIARGEVVELSLAPMGADFSRLVAAQPDAFAAHSATGDDLVEASPSDVPFGARVLTVLPYDAAQAVGYGLIAPLDAAGSIVLVRNPDDAQLPAHARTERVTHTLGVDISDATRLD